MSKFIPEGKMRIGHCAVSLDNLVLLIGGLYDPKKHLQTSSTWVIWSYNLFTEEWKRHEIPRTGLERPSFHEGVAVAIDKAIYTFGGYYLGILMNAVWKLSRTKEGCFIWSKTQFKPPEKLPSPRARLTGWEYTGKLWIFGGYAHSLVGYLNDHGNF